MQFFNFEKTEYIRTQELKIQANIWTIKPEQQEHAPTK